jgi:hypothetical protein
MPIIKVLATASNYFFGGLRLRWGRFEDSDDVEAVIVSSTGGGAGAGAGG